MPCQRVTPEVANLGETVASQRAEERTAGEEHVPRLQYAQLVGVGIGENDVLGVWSLTDVQVPGAELKRSLHCGRVFLE